YRATLAFPGEERFGLTIQLRRNASDMPTNLADGTSRETDAEFRKALFAAMSAGSRLEYLLLLAHDLGYLLDDDQQRLTTEVIEVKRMLAGLLHSVHG